MKLLTLNTHSLVEEDSETKRATLVAALVREQVDLIALQEVNQSRSACEVDALPRGFTLCRDEIPLREDNFARALLEDLAREGLDYTCAYLPVKLGYGKYDEGLAVLCRMPIREMRVLPISRTRDYENWRTRMALCVRPEGQDAWFCNLHMSWWDDESDPFPDQWERLRDALPQGDPLFLMGDLNNPAEMRGEGYDRVSADGFYDTYLLAATKSGGGTVCGAIDGWHGRCGKEANLRIDQIWCSRPIPVLSYRTLFDGREYERVSDHAGVLITLGKSEVRQ